MAPADSRGTRVPLLGIFAFWTLFGLWSAQQNALLTVTSGNSVESWPRLFVIPLASAWFWAAITPLLMWNTRRVHERTHARARMVAAHVAAFLVVHVVDAAFYAILLELAGRPTRPFSQLIFSVASYNALTYGVVVMATLAFDYRAALRDRAVRTAQLETQLAMAHFHALRAQLHPHFLFNSLNAISALIHKDPERAERMLARLSELLRIAIETAVTPEIRLLDEVEFVRRYLDIERMRFGDRLSVRVEIAADTFDSLVPSMLLQPLVENAVRHGVAPKPGPGRVAISAERTGPNLRIVVNDTGNGMDEGAMNGSAREGVGLSTTRARLEKLYGPAQELTLVNLPGGGFESRVTLPFKVREEAGS
jgi:two-component system LytT family sensor kinase